MSVEGVTQFGKYLGPADYEDLLNWFRRGKSSFEYLHFDGQLMDLFLSHTKDSKEYDTISESKLAPGLTKRFNHLDKTMAQLDGFVGMQAPNFQWNKNFIDALEILKRFYHIPNGSLQPLELSVDNASKLFSNLNASCGVLSVNYKKGDKLKEIISTAKRLKQDIAVLPFEDVWLPALPFHRAQISGYLDDDDNLDLSGLKQKDRLVWCIDAATVGVEAQYARPAIDTIAGVVEQYAGGYSNDEIALIIRRYYQNKQWIGVDYSSYDQTVPSWLIHSSFEVIRSWFPSYCKRELQWIEYQFIHTRILTYEGKLFQKHRGIPSGSYFTQLVGSMCNLLIILTYLCHHFGGREKTLDQLDTFQNSSHYSVMTMGDDALLATKSSIDTGDMEGYIWHNFGVKFNSSKCATGGILDPPQFLKREWHEDGQGRNYLDLVINVIHPEWERSYEGYSPYHILYGLYLTYRHTLKRYFSEQELVDGMMSHRSGLNALRTLDPMDMPGSVRVYRDVAPDYLYNRAKAFVSNENELLS